MTLLQLTRQIQRVQRECSEEMAADLRGAGHVRRGLSTEGWEGGYAQALRDTLSFINGYTDSNSRHERKWKKP